MANNNLDREIHDRINNFLGELSSLVRRAALEAVHEALGTGAAPAKRGPGRPRGSVRRGPGRPRKAGPVARAGKRVRRSAEDLEAIAVRVLAHVKANAGHRLEEIGRALKTDTAILKRPISNLLAARQLRTEGQKRGTKYFAGGGRGAASSGRKAKSSGRRGGKRRPKASRKGASSRAAKAPAAAAA
jgi:hypothetical protein